MIFFKFFYYFTWKSTILFLFLFRFLFLNNIQLKNIHFSIFFSILESNISFQKLELIAKFEQFKNDFPIFRKWKWGKNFETIEIGIFEQKKFCTFLCKQFFGFWIWTHKFCNNLIVFLSFFICATWPSNCSVSSF